MTALLRKEVRSILPAWAVAMVLATLPVWFVWPSQGDTMINSLGVMVFGPFGLGVLLLSITPFGNELNWGTFPVLLSQPISRRRLWLVKVVVVAVALGVVFAALCVSNYLRVDSTLESMKHTVWRNAFDRPGEQNQFFTRFIAWTRREAWQDTILIGGLEVLAGFAGGLWTTLLFRQVTAAFWLTLLVPMGLTVLASTLLKNFSDAVGRVGLALILGSYSAAGFFWAKRFFLRVQDTLWTGGTVSLPNWDELVSRRGSPVLRRRRRPLRALIRKEFQAQQVNILLAGGLLLVHLGVVAFRRWGAEYLATHHSLAMMLEEVPLLWLVMPLLIGSVAVAEERKLGTFQSNLCLPAGRRGQFLAKLGVATALGITLGGILPLLLESLAPHNSITGSASGLTFLGSIRPMESLQLVGSVGLTLLAFYGSTLTRNTLQAMGAGLLGAVLTCLVIFLAQHAGDSAELILWRGPLVYFIGWPVMLLTLFLLAYRNYTKLQPDLRIWIRNGAALVAALLCVAVTTTVVFHRAWEAWLPDEPLHRFTGGGASFLQMGPGPEGAPAGQPGRRGSGYLGITLQELTPTLAKKLKVDPIAGVFVAHVTPNSPAEKAGLKGKDVVVKFDGMHFSNSGDLVEAVAKVKPDTTVPIEIVREGSLVTLEVTVGQMSDMRQIAQHRRTAPKLAAAGSQKAVVLPDGRLWLQHRRARAMEQRTVANQGVVVLYESGPQHTGFVEGSRWKDVAMTQGGCFGIQVDGTLWDLSETGLSTPRKPVGEGQDWESISAGGEHFSALKSDRTLWQWGWKQTASGPNQVLPTQVGTDDDWIAVSDYWTTSAAIKSDGTVWRWDWGSRTFNHPQLWLTNACAEAVSLTLRAHVVAMVGADGSLWIGGEELTNSIYTRFIAGGPAQRATREMVRWRNDTDWKQISFVGWGRAVGIKRDGTLWEWDLNRPSWPAMGWVVPPKIPSRYADWMSVGEDNNAFLALARDGQLCLWGDPDELGYDYWNGYPNPRTC